MTNDDVAADLHMNKDKLAKRLMSIDPAPPLISRPSIDST